MSRRRFIAWNAAMPTTGDIPYANMVANTAPALTVAGTTLMQINPSTNIAIIEWGYELSAIPTALVSATLSTTGTVGATVTAYGSSDIIKYDDAGSAVSAITLGTSASGRASSAEGTVTATRFLDQGPGWSQFYTKQFPLDREPGVQAGDFARIRVTAAAAISSFVRCYMVWEE
jgi:hypothetical protein